MPRMTSVVAIGILALSFSGVAQAQHHAVAHPAPMPPAVRLMPQPPVHAPHIFSGVSLRPPLPGSPLLSSGTGRVVRNNNDDDDSNVIALPADSSVTLESLLNPSPGLGFDFAHLAAIEGDLGVKALIDPITQGRLRIAERLLRETPRSPVFFTDFGSVIPVAYTEPQPQPTPQPQIIVLQQPAASVTPAPAAALQPTSEPDAAPLPDAAEFLLALKDSSRISAVAFTKQNDKLVYVTAAGIRRSVAIANIDIDATTKLNEERGTPLRLPI